MRKEIYENQESSDTLPFHWEFGKEEITLKVSSYAYGNGLAVLMYSQSEGELELFSDLTVNLPGGYGLKTQEAFVSGDFTRDKLAFIQENRLGKVLLQSHHLFYDPVRCFHRTHQHQQVEYQFPYIVPHNGHCT